MTQPKPKLATPEQIKEIYGEVNVFLEANFDWNDARNAAKSAIGEYIASKQGLTLYHYKSE